MKTKLKNIKNGVLAFLSILLTTPIYAETIPTNSASPQTKNIITVIASNVGSNVYLGGTVVPYKEVTLTAQVPGRIEFIAGEEGDAFDDKNILVTINDEDLLAQRRSAVAAYHNAEASLRNAGVQYSREMISPYGGQGNDNFGGMPSMFNRFMNPMRSMTGGGSPGYERHADLYSYGSQLEQARHSLESARSQIDSIDAKLRDTQGLAPFAGVIVKKLVEVGDTVQPGTPLIAYADVKYLQVQVEVPARLMPSIKKGMIVKARLDVGNTEVEARVAQIYPVADVQRHTVTVKLDLPEGVPGGPGMYTEVIIQDTNTPTRSLPAIPKSSLVWRGSLPAVYVLNDNNSEELRLVRVGSFISDDTVTVLSGVRIGERIVENPQNNRNANWKTAVR